MSAPASNPGAANRSVIRKNDRTAEAPAMNAASSWAGSMLWKATMLSRKLIGTRSTPSAQIMPMRL
jgi:hypothetical protein